MTIWLSIPNKSNVCIEFFSLNKLFRFAWICLICCSFFVYSILSRILITIIIIFVVIFLVIFTVSTFIKFVHDRQIINQHSNIHRMEKTIESRSHTVRIYIYSLSYSKYYINMIISLLLRIHNHYYMNACCFI